MNPEVLSRGFSLGDVRVEPDRGLMTLPNGEQRRLARQPMEVLLCLASRHGAVVKKTELMDSVWGPSAGSDEGLKRNLHELRRALNDDAKAPRYLETIPRRGYRCVAEVTPRLASVPKDDRPASASAEPPAAVTERPQRPETLTVSDATAATWDGERTDSLSFSYTGPPATTPYSASPTIDAASAAQRANQSATGRRPRLALLLAAGAALLIASLSLVYQWVPSSGSPHAGEPTSTPAQGSPKLVNVRLALSPDPAQAPLAQRLSDAVVDALARVPGLVPTQASPGATGNGDAPPGSSFTLEYSVTGTAAAEFRLQQDGLPRVVLTETANLALSVENEANRIALQVARNILDEPFEVLKTAVTSQRTTGNDLAYLAYLRGRTAYARRGEADLREAIDHFQQALQHDPQYARAFSNMASMAWASACARANSRSP